MTIIDKCLRLFRRPRCSSARTETESLSTADSSKAARVALQKIYLPSGVFPSQFSISLGSAPCNHTCLFCPQSVSKPKQAKWLDLDLLAKMLGEMPERNITINFSSYSETMLCPILFPALELMKRIRPNLPTVMATNGSSVTEEKIMRLLDGGLDILSYSFDAANREDYRKLMQVDDFEKAERNLELICAMRDKYGSKMQILTHIMAFHNQKDNFELFRKKWEGKVDGISFRAVTNWGEDSLKLKNRLAENGFLPIYQMPERRYPCTSVFMHFKIAPDGHYYPCVAYVPGDDNSDMQKYSLGDAREISFEEGWKRLAAMREKHLNSDWNSCNHCPGCDIWGLWDDMWFEEDGKFYLDDSVSAIDCWK